MSFPPVMALMASQRTPSAVLRQAGSHVGFRFRLFLCRLYHITLWTFLLALGHFLSELFVFGTAAPTVGVLAPLMVASKHQATLDPLRGRRPPAAVTPDPHPAVAWQRWGWDRRGCRACGVRRRWGWDRCGCWDCGVRRRWGWGRRGC